MITTGAISISQALMVNQTLLELYMWGNKIGDDGITAIAGSISNSNITLLDVRTCGIGLVGVKSLAAALSSNQNIRQLWLSGNPITLDGFHLIMKTAMDNGVCEYVSISDDYEDEEMKRMMTVRDDRRQHVRNYVICCNYYCYGYKTSEDSSDDDDYFEALEVYSYVTINCIIYCYHCNRSYHSKKELQWM